MGTSEYLHNMHGLTIISGLYSIRIRKLPNQMATSFKNIPFCVTPHRMKTTVAYLTESVWVDFRFWIDLEFSLYAVNFGICFFLIAYKWLGHKLDGISIICIFLEKAQLFGLAPGGFSIKIDLKPSNYILCSLFARGYVYLRETKLIDVFLQFKTRSMSTSTKWIKYTNGLMWLETT